MSVSPRPTIAPFIDYGTRPNELEAIQDTLGKIADLFPEEKVFDPEAHHLVRPVLVFPHERLLFCNHLGEVLGRGAFKAACIGLGLSPNSKCVITQMVFREGCTEEQFDHEAGILERLRGVPHTVQLRSSFKADNCGYMAFDFCNRGDLLADLRERRRSISEMVLFAKQIVEAIWHVHQRGIIHGDVKLDNFFLNRVGNGPITVSLGDFGFSRDVDKETGSVPLTFYISPENASLSGSHSVSKAADMWSIGCVLWQLVTKVDLPWYRGDVFHTLYTMRKMDCAQEARKVLNLRGGKGYPRALIQLIKDLLASDPEKRPTAEQAYERILRVDGPAEPSEEKSPH